MHGVPLASLTVLPFRATLEAVILPRLVFVAMYAYALHFRARAALAQYSMYVSSFQSRLTPNNLLRTDVT